MVTGESLEKIDSGLLEYCRDCASRSKLASASLASAGTAAKNQWLLASADALQAASADLVAANSLDVAAAPSFGLTDAAIDRLTLDTARIAKIADALRQIARLPDPIGEVLEGFVRPNGLQIQKIRVPLGVVLFIYESRPNVTADAAAICVKSGNCVILRGGKEAVHSSRAIVDILRRQLLLARLPEDAVQLINTPDRDAVGHLLKLNDAIDVAIPRGGEGLIRRVVQEATMPVIKHFDGNCHVYVDQHADLAMAESIVMNSKTHRMGVCNACESLLVHESIASTFLPRLASQLTQAGVELRCDAAAMHWIPNGVLASELDWSTEYLGPIISVALVPSVAAAIGHINRYGSHHTDAIVTSDLEAARQFTVSVDSAAVMVNASTRFNDGGEFGLGAEIGISTDKFHARGPCGLKELTSYKYVVYGTGQVRS